MRHRGDSNEYTQYTNFNLKKKITLNYPKSAAMRFLGTQERIKKKAVIIEQSVFDLQKFYCTSVFIDIVNVILLHLHK